MYEGLPGGGGTGNTGYVPGGYGPGVGYGPGGGYNAGPGAGYGTGTEVIFVRSVVMQLLFFH